MAHEDLRCLQIQLFSSLVLSVNEKYIYRHHMLKTLYYSWQILFPVGLGAEL